ncbi:hypothetical protein V1T75_08790 [Tenacibaculum sp. FZY0031]|uniref:hypothetical protein n=1 Tax=unclassified Tenacibaculum TaxID=2635139 RepID=UPI002ECB6607|nr:hypothetical protein [Tenacibaculum sp. FZY0031]
MKNITKKFYIDFYNRTNGFIPSKPLNQHIYPGDFFQIHKGEVIVLGNIFKNNIVAIDEVELEYGIELSSYNWNFSNGVTKPYSGRDSGKNPIEGNFGYSKQILAFQEFGSFFFTSEQPEAVRILNWNEIASELIIKLTQVLYSFRELYVVTESVTTNAWALAVSGSDKGELEIASEAESSGLIELFGKASSKTIQARDIEYYNRENKRIPSFFKAKKLIVQPEKLEVFISNLIRERTGVIDWANRMFKNSFHNETFTVAIPKNKPISVLDMLQANQLNPNTALQYFTWENASLDDVEKLFISYGD